MARLLSFGDDGGHRSENFEPTDRSDPFEGGQARLPFLRRAANEVASVIPGRLLHA